MVLRQYERTRRFTEFGAVPMRPAVGKRFGRDTHHHHVVDDSSQQQQDRAN